VTEVNTNGCESTNQTQVFLVLNPLPSSAVTNVVNGNICFTNPVTPLSVAFASGNGGNWYLGGMLVAANTNMYTPTNDTSSVTQYVFKVFEVNAATGCQSLSSTNVTLTVHACPVIQVVGNNIVLNWYGNLRLQCSTNLSSGNWVDVPCTPPYTNCIVGPQPPEMYFRLIPSDAQ
jgi:hypothetical protein